MNGSPAVSGWSRLWRRRCAAFRGPSASTPPASIRTGTDALHVERRKVGRRAEWVARLSRALPCRRWQAAHWLRRLLRVPHSPFVGRFRGGYLEVHPDEIASTSAYFLGFYEREVTIWALQQIQEKPPSLI